MGVIKNIKTSKLTTNYYYIDESGHILNDEQLFIHGCIKTDTPQLLTNVLEEVKSEIQNDIYFSAFKEKFIKSGFHAVENHPDIRTTLYRKLIKLNWRAYFVLVNKESDYFKSIQSKDEHEIFMISLTKLLFNRIRKAKDDKNIFIFETIQLTPKTLKQGLDTFFQQMNKTYNCEYRIVEKDGDINLAIIDYLNYVLHQILTSEKPNVRMEQNFELLAPKIALIHIQNTKTYLSRKNEEITVENLIKNW